MVLLVIPTKILTDDTARRYFAEKNGPPPSSPPKKDEEEETSGALAKMPLDPMAERRTPCIKTVSTTVSRTQLEAVFPLYSQSDNIVTRRRGRI